MESFQSIFQLNGKNGIRRSVTMDDSSLIYLWRSEPDTYIYTKKQIILGQNEIVTSTAINRILGYLWTNFNSLADYFNPNCKD